MRLLVYPALAACGTAALLRWSGSGVSCTATLLLATRRTVGLLDETLELLIQVVSGHLIQSNTVQRVKSANTNQRDLGLVSLNIC
jgi:hypothetical protein